MQPYLITVLLVAFMVTPTVSETACPSQDCVLDEDENDGFVQLKSLDGAASKRSAPGPSGADMRDYDCDGDGTFECGTFDYLRVRCDNSPVCGHSFKSGDHLLQHSCRCMKCFSEPGTAAAEAPVSEPTSSFFYGRWRNWNKLTETCSPWLMPRSDAHIQSILRYAKEHGFKVRPSGATHSAGGLVNNGESSNVLTVSLAEYVAPDDWEFSLNEGANNKASVIVNAGWSPLKLYEQIRPLNYFLPTQTSGPVFQLAGMVANCVHGGVYHTGFLHQYVTRMRVMLHDGTSRVIDQESELRFWRNSYGLLGIITSIEFSLEHRPQFQAYEVTKTIEWTEEALWDFITQDAHADLSEQDVPGGAVGDRQSLQGQFFMNLYPDKPELAAVVWRANENATEPGVPSTAPDRVKANYRSDLEVRVYDEVKSTQSVDGKAVVDRYGAYGDHVRHWGGPKVFPVGLTVNDGLAKNAKSMTSMGLGGPGMLTRMNGRSLNDGMFATNVPNVVYGAYYLDPKHLFEAFNHLRESFLEKQNDSVFAWNGPPELRFIKVADDAVLNPVPAGVYAVAEYMAFPIGNGHQGWKKAFKEIQDVWGDELGGKPHIAKFWGFVEDADGVTEPFHSSRACLLLTDEQKTTFNAYRLKTDPDEIFAGGDAMKLLQACT